MGTPAIAVSEVEGLGHPPAGRGRWFQWLFGVALVGIVIIVSGHLAEARAFFALTERAQPRWLVLGCLFQAGTYLADAGSWRSVLGRAGQSRPLSAYVGLGFAKLFVDQAVPSGGISGTLIIVRGLERRGVPTPVAMAAVVVDLYAYYAAYVLSVLAALVVLGKVAGLGTAVLITAGAFVVMALTVVGLLTALTTRLRRRLPGWLLRLGLIKPLLDAVAAADPALVRRLDLLARSFFYQLLIFAFDAATVWTMLRAVGTVFPVGPVFASYMVSSLARTLGILPGGIGTFEAASVAALHLVGVPLAAALAATLLFRGLSFWLPLLPGLVLARRESR